jgi:glycosyltransferase involved in cell wall biosynthesis
LPPFLIEQVIQPAIAGGRLPVILAEEWHTAEALITLHDQLETAGYPIVFPLRGGIEAHGSEVFARVRELGLTISDVSGRPESFAELMELLHAAPPADIYNLRFFMSQEMLRPFYAAADAVLANSGHEPFGLVGLEAMAAGGVVFTGATGEEYTLCGECAVALDTDSPDEIVSQVLSLKSNPSRVDTMRQAAQARAAAFTWEQMSNILLDKIKFVTQSADALPQPNGFSSRR